MARVQIPYNKNPTQEEAESGSSDPKRGRPFLFQVLAPGTDEPLFPVALALHTNPRSVEEKMQKGKTVVPTYGGFIEFVWPDEFDTITCDHSTGAFIGPSVGLTAGGDRDDGSGLSAGRKGTIAWERQEDMLELFHNNGVVYNGFGEPVIRGRVMMMYDRGIFVGHFTSFSVQEDDSHAYSFELSWEFKVETVLYRFPSHGAGDDASLSGEP